MTSPSTTLRGRTNNSGQATAATPYPLGRSHGSGVQAMSARLAGIETRLARMEMGARANQISFSSMIGGDLSVVDLLGELKMKIGTHSDGKFGVSYHAGVAPPPPTTPLCSAREGYIVVGWDGEFADGGSKPTDFVRVDVHVSTTADFMPDATTAVASLTAESVTLVPGGIDNYYIRLVAVNNADVPSIATQAVTARPLPLTNFAAGSIAAIHLAAELILSTTIVAGNPNGAHLEMNPTGLRGVRADGTPTFTYSSEEGNVIITGTIQTAPPNSGQARIVFNPFPGQNYNAIRFYSPDGSSWSSLAAAYDLTGTAGAVQLSGPLNSSSSYLSSIVLGNQESTIGIFGADGYMTTGMSIRPSAQQVIGNNISFVFNYQNNVGYYDPFFAWVDSAASTFHLDSLVQMVEVTDTAAANKRHWSLSSASHNVELHMWKNSVSILGYNATSYAHLYALETSTSSSEAGKTNFEDLSEALSDQPAGSALGALAQIAPRRYQRIDRAPDVVEVSVPPVTVQEYVEADPQTAAEISDQTQQVELPKPMLNAPEYGLIAEEVRDAAPDATIISPNGELHLRTSGVLALLWAAVRELSEKVDNLESEGSNG